MLKMCIGCNEGRSEEDFSWNASKLSRMGRCKSCVKEAARQRTAKHRSKSRADDWKPKVTKQEPCSTLGHVCITCKGRKLCDEYFPNKSFKYNHDSMCKECKHTRRKERFANHQKSLEDGTYESWFRKDQIARLKNRFNITVEQYEYLLSQQNNVCFICEQPETRKSGHTGKPMNLAVDHDRQCCPTNKSCGKCIRGLLCTDCNTSLGKLECKLKVMEKLPWLAEYSTRRPLELHDANFPRDISFC